MPESIHEIVKIGFHYAEILRTSLFFSPTLAAFTFERKV